MAPILALALLAALPGAVRGEEGAPPFPAARAPGRPWLGAAATLGFPAGLGLGLAARPFPWLRLGAGLEHNTLAAGFHGEVTVVPLSGRLRPTVGLRAGRGLHADARRLAPRLGVAAADAELLRGVDYRWAAAELGLEAGPARGLGVFAAAGLAVAWGRLPHFEDRLRASNPGLTASADDPRVRLVLPTFTVGLVYWR